MAGQVDKDLSTVASAPDVRGEREDGGPVNLAVNGTLGPSSVQWHLKVKP